MKKMREITAKDVNLKPESYDDCRIIWTLNHFEKLKKDFTSSFIMHLSTNLSTDAEEFKQMEIARHLCDALVEFTYLIESLDMINLNKNNYKTTCDYKTLIKQIYIKKDEKELARKVGRSSINKANYSYSSKVRDIRYAAYYLDSIYSDNPDSFKHLTDYMKNIT